MSRETAQDGSTNPQDEAAWRLARAEARLEAERLAALVDIAVLDSPPEPHFDDLVRQAARRFETPVALLSLVDADRQWFKAAIGLGETRETARALAFCDHAIRQSAVFVVPDASADPRFQDNPLVTGAPNIRFYAGAPLELPEGTRLGTLCVIDTAPRVGFDAADRAELQALARDATAALLARRKA